ncbi:MAG: FtsK/SpoIIIE domain-containing protein, partial [Acidimicrobiia bacterium]|nr:FtsK/SpoIIIE domain-containing protein [Acidimicrobiia bacterium]
EPGEVETVVAGLSQTDEPGLVLVVDASGLDPRLRSRLTALVDAGKVSAIVIEGSAEDLPGSCTAVVTVSGSSGELRVPGGDDPPTEVSVDGVQEDVATLVARHLWGLDDPEEISDGARLPSGVTFGELAGHAGDAEGLMESWSGSPDGLEATVGMTEHGPLTIDLVADGPHGLVAGTTGSGKSEFLRTMVTALAANYGPERVTFALVDYKGGSAFDVCKDLPHVVGQVTDLDRTGAQRALRSLEAELRHREEVLRIAGVDDITRYPRSGEGEALPRLVVIIDEFAALAADLPEFVPSLVDIAQRGRSLGIHLILATQRPTGIVSEAIRANTNLRVGLRMQTAGDSRDVLDDPRAAGLPRRFPGRGLVRLGPGELIPFQTAQSTSGTGLGKEPLPVVRRLRFGWEPVSSEPDPIQQLGPNDLERLVEAANGAMTMLGLREPRKPWAEPLPEMLDIGDEVEGGRRVIGLIDEPSFQRTSDLIWDPTEGGMLAFGVEESGASDAIVAAACAAGVIADPDLVHIYALDGGRGALGEMAGWGHVGGVIRIADRERTDRLVRRLHGLLEDRRLGASGEAMVLVVIDRLGTLLTMFDGPRDMAIREALIQVIVDGPSFGILPLLSTDRPGSIPAVISSSISQRFCFRLADPFEYAAVGLIPRDVPNLRRGRGFDATGRAVQIGRPSARAIGRLTAAFQPNRGATAIRVLPDRVPLDVVLRETRFAEDERFLPVGLGDRDLSPVGFRIFEGDHVL